MTSAPAVIGKQRGTGACILLTLVTLGIYPLYWYYQVHQELRAHSGAGLGGPIALLLAVVVGAVMPFLTAGEVGGLYGHRGQPEPVSTITGVWILLPLVGAVVWFVKTNAALNRYWAELAG